MRVATESHQTRFPSLCYKRTGALDGEELAHMTSIETAAKCIRASLASGTVQAPARSSWWPFSPAATEGVSTSRFHQRRLFIVDVVGTNEFIDGCFLSSRTSLYFFNAKEIHDGSKRRLNMFDDDLFINFVHGGHAAHCSRVSSALALPHAKCFQVNADCWTMHASKTRCV